MTYVPRYFTFMCDIFTNFSKGKTFQDIDQNIQVSSFG